MTAPPGTELHRYSNGVSVLVVPSSTPKRIAAMMAERIHDAPPNAVIVIPGGELIEHSEPFDTEKVEVRVR